MGKWMRSRDTLVAVNWETKSKGSMGRLKIVEMMLGKMFHFRMSDAARWYIEKKPRCKERRGSMGAGAGGSRDSCQKKECTLSYGSQRARVCGLVCLN